MENKKLILQIVNRFHNLSLIVSVSYLLKNATATEWKFVSEIAFYLGKNEFGFQMKKKKDVLNKT